MRFSGEQHTYVSYIEQFMPFEYFGSLQCEFERRKPDGTTTLGLLHPVDPVVGGGFTELDRTWT